MGYNIHISRRKFWTKPLSNDITYDEWKGLAESDPDFEKCGETMWDLGRVLVEDDSEPEPYIENVVVYNSYGLSAHPDYPSFDYHNGRVEVRSPDEITFRKIFEIARKLGAVVQGDEGEFYRLTDRGVERFWEDPTDGPPALIYPSAGEKGGKEA